MTKLHVVRLGEGNAPPLVLLHGWGQDHRALYPLGELLAGSRPVHLVDLPGFGRSDLPPGAWSAGEYARCILDYLEANELVTCDLFGHSFGGKIALTLSHHFPDRVRRLILLNSSGVPRKKTTRGKAIQILGKVTKGIDRTFRTSLFRETFTPRFGSTDYLNAGAMRPVLLQAVNESILPLAKGLQTKTLLIWGEKDSETPLYMGTTLHELIPDSELLVLEGKGHSPFLDAGHHLLTHYMEPFLQ
jgi:pimeloyl-ACP methyl ester carboxylesterase